MINKTIRAKKFKHQLIYPDQFSTTSLGYASTSAAMRASHNQDDDSVYHYNGILSCCYPRRWTTPGADYEPMVIYSADDTEVENLWRYKILFGLVWFFVFANIALLIAMSVIEPFGYDPSAFENRSSASFSSLFQDSQWFYDSCNIVVCVISLAVLSIGILAKNHQIILLFVIVYAIDCFINLVRAYSALQFGYFLSQLILIYIANFFRVIIAPTWYFSR